MKNCTQMNIESTIERGKKSYFKLHLVLGKIYGRRRRGQQSMRWLDVIADSMDLAVGVGQGGLACCEAAKSQTRLSD